MFKKNKRIKSEKTIQQIITKMSLSKFIKTIETDIKQTIFNAKLNQYPIIKRQDKFNHKVCNNLICDQQQNIASAQLLLSKNRIKTLPAAHRQSLNNSYINEQKKQFDNKLKSSIKFNFLKAQKQKKSNKNFWKNQNEKRQFLSEKKSIKAQPYRITIDSCEQKQVTKKKISQVVFKFNDIPQQKTSSLYRLQKFKIIDENRDQIYHYFFEQPLKNKQLAIKHKTRKSINLNSNRKQSLPKTLKQHQQYKLHRKTFQTEQLFKNNQLSKQMVKMLLQDKQKNTIKLKSKMRKCKYPKLSSSQSFQQSPFEFKTDQLDIRQNVRKQHMKTSPQKFRHSFPIKNINKKNFKQVIEKNICGWEINQIPHYIYNL